MSIPQKSFISNFLSPLGAILLVILVSLVFFISAAGAQSGEDPFELGGRIYSENCAVCHGANGEGRVGATLSQNWPSIRPDLTVRSIIVNGVPGSPMPAWSSENGGPLSSEEIDALVYFILSWQTGGAPDLAPRPTATAHPPITPVPEVEGDPNRGLVLYAENCAVCHGADGEGRVGATLVRAWPAIRPDLSIKSSISNGIAGSQMPAWSLENGGPLSESEIDDIVSYLLSKPSTSVEVIQPIAPTPTPITSSFLTGWGGVLVGFGLLAVILFIVFFLQRKSNSSE